MNPTENGHGKFKVSTSGLIVARMKELLDRAVELGEEDRFIAATRRIYERLENDPHVFGEPLYHLKSLALEVRLGIVLPLAITYGINYSVRVVFVSQVKSLTSS